MSTGISADPGGEVFSSSPHNHKTGGSTVTFHAFEGPKDSCLEIEAGVRGVQGKNTSPQLGQGGGQGSSNSGAKLSTAAASSFDFDEAAFNSVDDAELAAIDLAAITSSVAASANTASQSIRDAQTTQASAAGQNQGVTVTAPATQAPTGKISPTRATSDQDSVTSNHIPAAANSEAQQAETIKHGKTHSQLVKHYTSHYHGWTAQHQKAKTALASPHPSTPSNSAQREELVRREKWASFHASNSAALAHYHLNASKGQANERARPPSPPAPPSSSVTVSRPPDAAKEAVASNVNPKRKATQDATARTSEGDALQMPQIRKALMDQYKEKGLKSIGHICLLFRWAHSTKPTPIFFFTKNTQEITLGSKSKLLENMRSSGLSERGIRFSLADGKLSVVSLNCSDTSFRLVRADESEESCFQSIRFILSTAVTV